MRASLARWAKSGRRRDLAPRGIAARANPPRAGRLLHTGASGHALKADPVTESADQLEGQPGLGFVQVDHPDSHINQFGGTAIFVTRTFGALSLATAAARDSTLKAPLSGFCSYGVRSRPGTDPQQRGRLAQLPPLVD